MGPRAPAGPWHVNGFVENQNKSVKDQNNMLLLYYLLDVLVEISGDMKYKYMLCIWFYMLVVSVLNVYAVYMLCICNVYAAYMLLYEYLCEESLISKMYFETFL